MMMASTSSLSSFVATPFRAIRRSVRILHRRLNPSVLDEDPSPGSPNTPDVLIPETQDQDRPGIRETDGSPEVIPETQTSGDLSVVEDSDSSLSSDDESETSSLLVLDLPAEPVVPTTTAPFPETVVNRRPTVQCEDGLILFFGPKNPLSAFFHHPLRWKNRTYISAEIAYQHEKFTHHRLPSAAHNELLRCRSSHDAKRVASKWVAISKKSWEKLRFEVMEQICTAKLHQCKALKAALRKSGQAQLVHNTETDPIWGCGPDFRGQNMMGRILMDVRKRDAEYQLEYPALPASRAVPKPQTPQQRSSKRRVLVLGNSNARGISQGLCERGIDATGFVYPGQTIDQLKGRIDATAKALQDRHPDAILVHAGDIEARERTSLSSITSAMQELTVNLQRQFPSSRIILSGLPLVPGNKPLDGRIAHLNTFFSKMCQDLPGHAFLCNKRAKLQRDQIHLTALSRDLIARTTACYVKKCV